MGPPDAVQLAESGDRALLDELVPLLAVRDRAWAAEVMLAALTGVEADLVASYTGKPETWIDGLGATAPVRWKAWLDQHRAPAAATRHCGAPRSAGSARLVGGLADPPIDAARRRIVRR